MSRDPDALREWLSQCDDLESLRYGSHRKYESQKPELIWSVIESFILLVDEFDTPTRLFSVGADEADDGFDCLYRRLRPVLRFGRTGRFDFESPRISIVDDDLLVRRALFGIDSHNGHHLIKDDRKQIISLKPAQNFILLR